MVFTREKNVRPIRIANDVFSRARKMIRPAILLKFTHFQLCVENKQLRLHIVLGLPHILTVIYVFNKRFH